MSNQSLEIKVDFNENSANETIFPESSNGAKIKGWINVCEGQKANQGYSPVTPIYFWISLEANNIPKLTIKSVYFEIELLYSNVGDEALKIFTKTSFSDAIKRFVRLNGFIHSYPQEKTSKHSFACKNFVKLLDDFKFKSEEAAEKKKICLDDENIKCDFNFFIECKEVDKNQLPITKAITVTFGKKNSGSSQSILKQEIFLENSLYNMQSFASALIDDIFAIMKQDSIPALKKVTKSV